MKELLYLVHRIPYPPNKGDKIRSFNLLKHLAERYRVHLGAFIDNPDDWRYVDKVKSFCEQTCFASLDPRWARIKSVRGLFTGEPLTYPYFRDAGLATWVRRLLGERNIGHIVAFSSSMAQYAQIAEAESARRVMDFVDVDSDKWRQYSHSKPWPLSWLYRREARTLLEVEREVAREFDASVFVSELEARLFRELAPESADCIHSVHNGVDTDFFDPAVSFADPYEAGEQVVVFTGAMDYWANVEAVSWFARQVFPRLQAEMPAARFYIVGARPVQAVQDLARTDGIRVTGTVEDVRPYLAHARVAVAPLRIARGVQNKVLEAMAMTRPVVATTMAVEGIVDEVADNVRVTDDETQMADHLSRLLSAADSVEEGRRGRRLVLEHYDWNTNLARLRDLVDPEAAAVGTDKSSTPGAASGTGEGA